VLELAAVQEGLRVSPDHRRMEFEFTALSFIGAENISFRYRLEGVDEDWVQAVSQRNERNAIYPWLPPGDYRFQVNACNSEGIRNAKGATLTFLVLPFFWQTWWFRTGVILTFTWMVIAIVRYVSFRRLRAQLTALEQQAALHKERARIAKDIHDDLGANLTQISLVGELAHQDRETPEKVTAHLDKISGTVRQPAGSSRSIRSPPLPSWKAPAESLPPWTFRA
jgi:signal transduction histidine kinase